MRLSGTKQSQEDGQRKAKSSGTSWPGVHEEQWGDQAWEWVRWAGGEGPDPTTWAFYLEEDGAGHELTEREN